MKELIQLKGTNGKISVFEDRIVISRNTFGGIAAFGLGGEKTYYYSAIQGVELAGAILRIIPKGADNQSYNAMNYADILKATKDSNVILVGNKIKLAQEICEIVTTKINEIYSNSNNVVKLTGNNSNADEILKFKKLLDDGIITQEEFEKKKEQLLK